MPAPATAFPAGLVATFDLSGAPSMSARRAAGPNAVDVLPEAQPDSFEDLLGLAVAGAQFNPLATQPILKVPAQPPETSVVQGAMGGSAESAQRASLLATVAQNGRLTAPSNSAIASVGEIATNQESGVSPELQTATDGEPSIVATSSPNADVSTNDGGSREAADQSSATDSVIASRPFVSAQSTVVEQAPTEDVSAEVEVETFAARRTDHPVETSAGAHVVASTSTGIPIQDAAPSPTDAAGDEGELDVTAIDSQTAPAPSAEGLRPVSELAQDVQTVPQPEAPASSVPAAIVVETAAIPNEAVAAGVAPAVTSSPGAVLRTASDEAIGVRGARDRAGLGGKDVRVGTQDSSAFDVMATTGELAEQAITAAQKSQTSSGDDTPSEQGSGTGADANSAAMTTIGSSSATGAPASPSEAAVSGSSVVQQISSAVQDWRAALQEQGTARFSAWLNPPNLGHVYVELSRSADGITARLSASDDGVQSILESQGPELRQALNDAGIAVTELDVSGHSAADSGSQQQQQPPPDRPEELETTTWRAESQPHRRPSSDRSGAVDVRV